MWFETQLIPINTFRVNEWIKCHEKDEGIFFIKCLTEISNRLDSLRRRDLVKCECNTGCHNIIIAINVL